MSGFVLADAPEEGRSRELWLQHLAGFILWEEVRGYALSKIAPDLSEEAKAAAVKAVDDALYGLMMVVDGVTGGLKNTHAVASLDLVVRYEANGHTEAFDLAHGDGMCMGYHFWKAGNFGEIPVATPRSEPV